MNDARRPDLTGIDWNLYERFERLLEVRVLDARVLVPENNTLLRGLQYAWPQTVPYGNFCWNGDCENCHAFVEEESGRVARILCCQTPAREDARIVRLGPELEFLVGASCRGPKEG